MEKKQVARRYFFNGQETGNNLPWYVERKTKRIQLLALLGFFSAWFIFSLNHSIYRSIRAVGWSSESRSPGPGSIALRLSFISWITHHPTNLAMPSTLLLEGSAEGLLPLKSRALASKAKIADSIGNNGLFKLDISRYLDSD